MAKYLVLWELRAAKKRWQWVYVSGYASALYTAVSSFILKDPRGRTVIGFDAVHTPVVLVIAAILAALAWRVHRQISIASVIALFAIFLSSAIALSFGDDPAEIIGAWIFTAVLFRGVLAIRHLRRFRDEMLQRNQIAQQSPNDQSATGDSGTRA
jgi:hypothetical protein